MHKCTNKRFIEKKHLRHHLLCTTCTDLVKDLKEDGYYTRDDLTYFLRKKNLRITFYKMISCHGPTQLQV